MGNFRDNCDCFVEILVKSTILCYYFKPKV